MSFFFDYNNFKPNKIQYKTPNKREINGSMYSFIPLRCQRKPIFIKTPKLCSPFDVNCYPRNVYCYVVSFNDRDIDPLIEKFLNFLLKVETFCQSAIREKSKEWIGVEPDKLTFKTYIKDTENPLLRLKITPNTTELYDETGTFLDHTKIEQVFVKYCHITSLLELSNIWINETEYGITWKVIQAKIYPPTRPIGGVSLLDDVVNVLPSSQLSSPPPPPPPLTQSLAQTLPYSKPKLSSYINCFAMINQGNIPLKKTEQTKYQFQPMVSLSEILNIRNNLRKRP